MNKTLKVKHLIVLVLLFILTKFSFALYKSFHYIEITKNFSTEEAAKIIMEEKAEKWWLRF